MGLSLTSAAAASFFSGGVWDTAAFGNTLGTYTTALIIVVAAFVVLRLIAFGITRYFRRLAEKTETDIDDLIVSAAESIRGWFYIVVALYIGVLFVSLSPVVLRVVNIVALTIVVYQVIEVLGVIIRYLIRKGLKDSRDDARQAARFLGGIAKGILWALGVLLILQNAGVNVTSLIAGLGIGGIAIAFALQSILEDLFSSFAIFFDKPFEVGDYIVIGETSGDVEKIGIKTTRIRSLQGEEVVVPNKELTTVRIQNFRKLKERRVSFALGVVYETPNKKLKQIPEMLEKIVSETKMARFDRAHFTTFSDSSLDFEVVYYVESREFVDYRQVQENINNKIREVFEREKIEMAYPTRTVYVAK